MSSSQTVSMVMLDSRPALFRLLINVRAPLDSVRGSKDETKEMFYEV
jgi:hypothetical protein